MAEDEERRRASTSGTAASFALNAAADAVPAEDMRAFVREQTRLAALQSQNLIEQNSFELSHLRWQRFNDQMRGFLQVMAALVGALVVLAIAAAFWNAAHEDGLVIEAFSVPPDMAARGLTGQAVAAQLQDKLATMQGLTSSARPAASYSNNWGNDIRVEIPDTGVSVGEFYRYLVSWLGNQTHITGEVWRTAGGIAVTARAGGEGGATVTGTDAGFDGLLQQASEEIFRRTQPYRYAVYAGVNSPHPDREKATALFQDLLANSSQKERLWAAIGLGTLADLGDPGKGAYWMRRAIAIDPDFALPWMNLATDDSNFGHDEDALADERNAVRLLGNATGEMSEGARLISLASNRGGLEFTLCDFAASLRDTQDAANLPDYSGIVELSREALVVNYALLHQPREIATTWRELPASSDVQVAVNRVSSKLIADYWLGDWNAVVADDVATEQVAARMLTVPGVTPVAVNVLLKVAVWPYAATARAMTGDSKGAHALIDRTPLDCYSCVRNRADIAAAEKDWSGADYWFALAMREAPSIPMAYWDWGRVLLARGDTAGAIAKFKTANAKGPHFADPLEGWGEALMVQNRSDLALAKFAEAAQYAPNWGRLHLKWGEAAWWAGNRDEAAKHFAIAAGLELSAADRRELARMPGGSGQKPV